MKLAVSMGVHVRRIRAIGMALTSFITAGIISFTGTIGFIGLIAPHMSRSVIGGDHRFLIPLSGLIGAIILVLEIAASRIILAPQVIPVGL
jgi:iron complex transport system permease protein